MKKGLGTKMRHLLIDLGLGIREFCDRPDVDISPESFRNYFDKEMRPTYDIAKRLVKATDSYISMAELGYDD